MARTTNNTPERAPRERGSRRAGAARTKVTYSLPSAIVRELDRRAADGRRARSAVVSEALAFYFAEDDKRALAAVYAQAAGDAMFRADNDEVLADFAALDAGIEGDG
jgi:metal-responsive CopG/Arc/MetJ family transcriptional regulator